MVPTFPLLTVVVLSSFFAHLVSAAGDCISCCPTGGAFLTISATFKASHYAEIKIPQDARIDCFLDDNSNFSLKRQHIRVVWSSTLTPVKSAQQEPSKRYKPTKAAQSFVKPGKTSTDSTIGILESLTEVGEFIEPNESTSESVVTPDSGGRTIEYMPEDFYSSAATSTSRRNMETDSTSITTQMYSSDSLSTEKAKSLESTTEIEFETTFTNLESTSTSTVDDTTDAETIFGSESTDFEIASETPVLETSTLSSTLDECMPLLTTKFRQPKTTSHSNPKGNKKSRVFENEVIFSLSQGSSSFHLQAISVSVYLSSNTYSSSDKNETKVFIVKGDLKSFETPIGNAYECGLQETFNLGNDILLQISEIQIAAFLDDDCTFSQNFKCGSSLPGLSGVVIFGITMAVIALVGGFVFIIRNYCRRSKISQIQDLAL